MRSPDWQWPPRWDRDRVEDDAAWLADMLERCRQREASLLEFRVELDLDLIIRGGA